MVENQILKEKDGVRRTRKFTVAFALIFSFISCLAAHFQTALSVGFGSSLIVLVNTIIVSYFAFYGYSYFRSRTISLAKSINGKIFFATDDWKYSLKCTVIIFVLFMPVFLAYYPGFNNYDAYNQIKQGVVSEYSQWHPLAHTMWLKFFLYIIGGKLFGNYTMGWAIGHLCQMLIMSLSLSYMHLLIYRLRVGKYVRWILIVFFALNPIVSLMSISSTKDTLFACFFLLSCVCMAYWTIDSNIYKKKRMVILYIVSLCGTILFRNNGIYGVVAATVAGGIYMYLKKNRKFIVITLCGILAGVLGLNGLQTVTGAAKVDFNEALSMPYQQLAYVYNVKANELSDVDKGKILEMIPGAANYKCNYADNIKFGGQAFTNEGGIQKFMDIYISMGFKHPFCYFEALVQQNLGYLYILDTTSSEIQGSSTNGWSGYMETELREIDLSELGGHLEHKSFFPLLEHIYEKLFSLNTYKKIFPLFLICSLGLYFWFIVFIAFISIELKCYRIIIVAANIAGLLLTVFLGPMVAVRYALPYVISVPVLFFCFLSEFAQKNESVRTEAELHGKG